ncbi:MAG: phosphoribosylformylglycinamidine cyclo-ligase [bacterium]
MAGLTYKDAGVDIDKGNALIDRIKPHVKKTMRPEVLTGLGGFGGLFGLDTEKYSEPVLVSGTDGVGTKLKLAWQLGRHDTIGIDLVAMCVNDILACGAEPLFFLDYFATGHLDNEVAESVIAGVAEGCAQAGCALIGGETAEMPDMYPPGEYDLAGFTVGAVNKPDMIDGSEIKAGDVLLGIASAGPHSNGYSLIRKIVEVSQVDLNSACGDVSLGEALLAPTQIYVKALLDVLQQSRIAGVAHITGGGLQENIIRIIPDDLGILVDTCQWELPAVFKWLKEAGKVELMEMYRTFNCGVGMVLILEQQELAQVQGQLAKHQLDSFVIGHVRGDYESRVEIV